MNVEKNYKSVLNDLFSKDEYSGISQMKRGYAMPKEIEDNSILFIGINPSFNNDDEKRDNKSHFYSLKQDEGNFFCKFSQIAQFCNSSWSHLDLLPIREKSQSEIIELEKNHINLIWESLQITKQILEETKPKAIVIANTLARKYLGKDRSTNSNIWLGYDFGEMKEDGTFRIQSESNLQGIPVFFSGMLTGMRALDNGSFERLQWHIKKALKFSVNEK
jgi:hypothetical protein